MTTMTDDFLHLIQNASSETMLSSWFSWFSTLSKSLLSSKQEHARKGSVYDTNRPAAIALTALLTECRQFPGISKQLSMAHLPSFLGLYMARLQSAGGSCVHPWDARLLLTILRIFSGSIAGSGNLMDLVKLLCKSLQKQPNRLIYQCIAEFPRVGSPGERGSKHAARWSVQLRYLIYTGHECLAMLNSDTDHTACQKLTTCKPVTDLLWSFLPLPEYPTASQLVNRITNCLGILLEMLASTALQTSIEVPLNHVFSLIQCCLNATGPIGSNKSFDTRIIGFSNVNLRHSEIYCKAIMLARILVRALRLSSVLLAPKLNTLVFQTLLWTSELLHNHPKDSKGVESGMLDMAASLRSSTYSLLSDAALHMGAASMIGQKSSRLMDHIMKDFELCLVTAADLNIHVSEAKSANKAKKYQKRKSGKKIADSLLNEFMDLTVRKIPGQARFSQLILSCLKHVTSLVETIGHTLDASFHHRLQLACIRILCGTSQFVSLTPSSIQQIKLELYALLKALVVNPCPDWAPCVHPAIGIFTTGSVDPSEVIRTFCRNALDVCLLLARPRLPPIEFPIVPAKEELETEHRGSNINGIPAAAMDNVSQETSVRSGKNERRKQPRGSNRPEVITLEESDSDYSDDKSDRSGLINLKVDVDRKAKENGVGPSHNVDNSQEQATIVDMDTGNEMESMMEYDVLMTGDESVSLSKRQKLAGPHEQTTIQTVEIESPDVDSDVSDSRSIDSLIVGTSKLNEMQQPAVPTATTSTQSDAMQGSTLTVEQMLADFVEEFSID